MAATAGISLVALLLSGDECSACHDPKKQDRYGRAWVMCVGNKPQMVQYDGDSVIPVSSNLNAKDWDCSKGSSPKWIGSGVSSYPIGSLAGPFGEAKRRSATATNGFAVPPLLPLPFTPAPDKPKTAPDCDSSYADVIHVNHLQNTVSLTGGCTLAWKATVTVPDAPLQVVTTSDGRFALVTSFSGGVTAIDLSTFKVAYTIPTPGGVTPNGIAISPDDSRLYVTNFDTAGMLLTIDLASRRVVSTLPTNAYPSGAVLSPDGSQLWLTFPFGQTVWVVDTLSNTLAAQIAAPQTTGVAFDSTGANAYITSSQNAPGTVFQVNTQTFQTVKTYTVGTGPGDIWMSFADDFLVVNNHEGNSISVIDLKAAKVVTASTGNLPMGIIPVRILP